MFYFRYYIYFKGAHGWRLSILNSENGAVTLKDTIVKYCTTHPKHYMIVFQDVSQAKHYLTFHTD